MSVIAEIFETLGIPTSYLKYSNPSFIDICLVSRDWLGTLIKEKIISPFIVLEDYEETELQELIRMSGPEEFGPSWNYISVKAISKKEHVVCSSKWPSSINSTLLFSQVLHFVNQSNFNNLWSNTFNLLPNAHVPNNSINKGQSKILEENDNLVNILIRLYNCDFISLNGNNIIIDQEESKSHLIKAYCIIESKSFYLILLPFKEFSLYDSVMYSPALLSKNKLKQLYVFYQILHAVLEIHSRGLYFGNMKLFHMKIDDKLWLELDPDLGNCLYGVCFNPVESESSETQFTVIEPKESLKENSCDNAFGLYGKYLSRTTCDILHAQSMNNEKDIAISELVQQWVMNSISNFDYLLALNYISGRKFDDPKYYPIFPWILDFSYPDKGWRDLSKSKYRLNKGDKQLDATYDINIDNDKESLNSLQAQVPHHVTDFLSEITYYVYNARRTPKSILCKYVRSVWVPAEYPSSMLRLQKWTPEECIPDFYCDPSIFKSVHPDLSDLEVPWWSSSPEDFIAKHRTALESLNVSERLHNWIDVVFGYKLTGPSSIKSKNVCLHLADNHVNLMKTGIVQLFTHPHPQKLMPNNYFSCSAPRLKLHEEINRSLPDIEDETNNLTDSHEDFRNRSKTSASNEEKHLEIDSLPCISLPKDLNPVAQIYHLESLHYFLTKMCAHYDHGEGVRKTFLQSNLGAKLLEDTVVIGCLFIELVLFDKMVMANRDSKFNDRVGFAKKVFRTHQTTIPRWLQQTLESLLNSVINSRPQYTTSKFDLGGSCISNRGLPPPSAYQLLQSSLSSIPFPPYFSRLHSLVGMLVEYKKFKEGMMLRGATDVGYCHEMAMIKLNELKIMNLAHELQDLLPHLSEEGMELIIPYIKELFHDKDTSILSAWYLFDIVGRALGRKKTTSFFLDLVMQVFDNDCCSGKQFKLYHRSFLIQMIVHFGLERFLVHFSPLLVEGVGGYKDSRLPVDGYRASMTKHPHLGSPELEVTIMSPTVDDDSSQADSVKETRLPTCQSSKLTNFQAVARESDNTTFPKEPEIFPFEEGDPVDSTKQWSNANEYFNDIKDLESIADSCNEDTLKYTPCSLLEDYREIEENATNNGTESVIFSTSVPAHLSWGENLNIPCPSSIQSHPSSPVHKTHPVFHEIPKAFNIEQSSKACNVSDVCAESVCWLAHRLGPVLTARHLTRNLLKMLTLCYYGNSMLEMVSSVSCDLPKISSKVMIGDQCCSKVLVCLSNIAGLYGENFILLQYFSHCTELVASCKKKLTMNLEAGLLGCMALLYHIVPYLCDVSIMDCLQEKLISQILYPTLKLVSSRRIKFPGGYKVRSLIVYRLLDVLYLVACRIGSEMTKIHLSKILKRFFWSFDRALNVPEQLIDKDGSEEASGTSCSFGSLPLNNDNNWKDKEEKQSIISQELVEVFTPDLAYNAYVPFCHLTGVLFMESNLKNETLIRKLCLQHEKSLEHIPENIAWKNDIKLPSHPEQSDVQVVGNRIDFQINDSNNSCLKQADYFKTENNTVCLTKKMENSTRHLKGNWMLYWEHEIGCPEIDSQFNFKQIKLQSYVGHNNSIKSLRVIDNENSFISCSKDKTVKLWSIRSQGDGSTQSSCQWTYSEHKKSVFNVIFIEASRLVASCDSSIHIWDPFMGSKIGVIDASRTSPITVIQSIPSPSQNFFAATTDGSVKIVDVRRNGQLNDIKVSPTPAGFIRALSVSPDGQILSVGHSSGLLSCLDIRTGMLLSSWKAHEGEILQVCSQNEIVISSSLDQSISVWNVNDGKLLSHIREPLEPVHCLLTYQDQLISGTTANRIGIHSFLSNSNGNINFTSTKLRSDTFRGVLTSLAILPLNKLFLTGADNGSIRLMC